MRPIAPAAALATLALCAAAHAAPNPPPPFPGCYGMTAADFAPTPGPLRLDAVYCGAPTDNRNWSLSPDGRTLAGYNGFPPFGIRRIQMLSVKGQPQALTDVGNLQGDITALPVARWADGSDALWAARREVDSHGFSRSGLTPIRIAPVGNSNITELPALTHPAGTLDKLFWLNGSGIALAVFGDTGDHPRPTYAIADAAHGKIIDTFDTTALTRGLTVAIKPGFPLFFQPIAGVVMADGRARILFEAPLQQWIVWTQGQAPRLIAGPLELESRAMVAFSPDGRDILATRTLMVGGTFYENHGSRPGQPSGYVPAKPAEGPFAFQVSAETGKVVWTMRRNATNDFPRVEAAPVYRADGRYALIGLLPDNGPPAIALIEPATGRIVQTLPIRTRGDNEVYSMGFAGDGIWYRTYGFTAIFRFSPER